MKKYYTNHDLERSFEGLNLKEIIYEAAENFLANQFFTENQSPLSIIYPDVYFDSEYLSSNGDNWKDMYLNDSLFIAYDHQTTEGDSIAMSVEDIFQLYKIHNKFYCLGDPGRNLIPMSEKDKTRYLVLIALKHSKLFSECYEIEQEKLRLFIDLNHEAYNDFFYMIEDLIVFSASERGETEIFQESSIHNILSSFGYQHFLDWMEGNFSEREIEKILNQTIQLEGKPDRKISDLLDSAKKGDCTTLIAKYWIALLKEFRPRQNHFSTKIEYSNLNSDTQQALGNQSFFTGCRITPALFNQQMEGNRAYAIRTLNSMKSAQHNTNSDDEDYNHQDYNPNFEGGNWGLSF